MLSDGTLYHGDRAAGNDGVSMRIIGLTGGIGAGKSEVARLLAKRDIPVINADKLSREVVEPGTKGLKAVIAKFGDTVLRPDGGLNRKALAARVFENKRDRRSLEAILHPLIRERAEAHLGLLEESGAQVVVLESPLLFEASQDDLCDAVIVVVSREELRARRCKRRDGMTLDGFQARLDAQMSDKARIKLADIIVENNGSLDELRRAVDAIAI